MEIESTEEPGTPPPAVRAILRAFDGLPVKGGLYFPLLQRWCPVEFTD